ncbi:MAG: helix-turn-helix transcriptional regulator [Tetrasphaera sp.]
MTVPMALLALLDSTPEAHGFALKHRYDDVLGRGQELKYGQVYSTLVRLERDGLARGVGVEQAGAPDRKLYAITAEGVTALEEWLATPELPGGRPGQLFTRVVLALISGRSAAQVLDSHRAVYLARMRELTGARGSGDVVDRLARDLELAHLEADLAWVELAGRRLAENPEIASQNTVNAPKDTVIAPEDTASGPQNPTAAGEADQ